MGDPDEGRMTHELPRVTRVLTLSPRLARETFWLEVEPAHPLADPHWNAEDEVGVFATDEPTTGPMLLWDQPLGNADDLDRHLEGFSGNRADLWQPEPQMVDIVVQGMTLIDDDVFWASLEPLRTGMSEAAIDRTVRALSSRDDDFLLRWEETAAQKAKILFARMQRWPGYAEYHRSFAHLIGAAIGFGEETYEAALRDPETTLALRLTDHSWSVLFLGSFARDRLGRGRERLVTSFTTEYARERDRSLEPDREPLAPDELRTLLEEARIDVADDLFSTLSGPDRRLHAGRALVEENEEVRMRLVLANISFTDHGSLDEMRAALESFGGEVRSPIEMTAFSLARPMTIDVFAIKRAFRGSREQYISRFIDPPA